MEISFDQIIVGYEYNRAELALLWKCKGEEALRRGIVCSKNSPHVILFITKQKDPSLPQYEDNFNDGVLTIEGESKHQADSRLVSTQKNEDEVHLFYRSKHHKKFLYEGRVLLVECKLFADKPSHFKFVCMHIDLIENSLETERSTHGFQENTFNSDSEGKRRLSQHYVYERSRKNRARALQLHGFTCKACGFNFDVSYGTMHANHFIEIHHVQSITASQGMKIDPEKDLIPLCSNCHSMAHRIAGRILSLEELQELVHKMK